MTQSLLSLESRTPTSLATTSRWPFAGPLLAAMLGGAGCQGVLSDIDISADDEAAEPPAPPTVVDPSLLPDAGDSPGPADCTEGESRCSARNHQVCLPTRRWETLQICDSAAQCRTSIGGCTELPCQPGVWQCSAGQLEVCLGEETGWVPGAQCASQTLCQRGLALCNEQEGCTTPECASSPCEPGEYGCFGPELQVCDDSGSSFSVVDTCASQVLCNLATRRCDPPTCSVSERRCEGNLLQRCEIDLSDFATEMLCDTNGGTCEVVDGLAQCVAPDCTPNAFVCDGARLLLCNAAGNSLARLETCGAGTVCNADLGLCQVASALPDAGADAAP